MQVPVDSDGVLVVDEPIYYTTQILVRELLHRLKTNAKLIVLVNEFCQTTPLRPFSVHVYNSKL
jgi:hypothetical protein